MTDILPPWSLLVAFFSASLLLAVAPGPGVLYIVTRSIAEGRGSGLASVAGVAVGNLANAAGAALGLGALLAVSSTAFLAVKYAGALYLLYLGVQVLRAPRFEAVTDVPNAAGSWPIFRDGFVVALLNPKTAVFFAAYLPQFMSSEVAPFLQSVTLGALFVIIAAVTDTVCALAAASLSPLLSRAQEIRAVGRFLTGGAYIGLGVFTAFGSSRAGR